jgi:predicted cupin superfamily sugar epimerase
MNAEDIIERFALVPHPEGGFYREIHRSKIRIIHPGASGSEFAHRPAGTGIYFLLPAGDFSAFHRLRSDETWHFYAGDDLELHLIHADGRYESRVITGELGSGAPVTTVEAGCWQAARVVPGGKWALCGCTVAPGFSFEDFEMVGARSLIRDYPEHEAVIRELTRSVRS